MLDGHGGKEIVEFVIKQFHKEFVKEYKARPKDVKAVFETVFKTVDEMIKAQCKTAEESGATASIGLIRLEEAKRVL